LVDITSNILKDIFSKKIKKKIYKISALKHKGIIDVKRALVRYVH